MANSGSKAELDKDGISLADPDKVDLDKDGIPLRDIRPGEAPQALASPEEGEPAEGRTQGGRAFFSKRLLLAAAALGLLAASGVGIGLWMRTPPETPLSASVPLPAPPPLKAEGELILDPFCVLFDPVEGQQAGVLICQLSLQMNPQALPNVEANLHEVRRRILEKLTINAPVYVKHEITDMIVSDLESLEVRDVAFLQYEMR